MLSIIALTNPNIISTLLGTIKQIVRPTLQGWKPSRMSYALTPSNVLTAEVIIRWTLASIFFGNTGLIMNTMLKNIKSFILIESNHFVQPWIVAKHDCKEYQDIFSKCLQKQFHNYVINKNDGLQFIFTFIFFFYFILKYFTFSIFRTLGLGLEWVVTLSHQMVWSQY